MSIILDALKKARKERRQKVDFKDDAVFSQIQYDSIRKRQKTGQSPIPRLVIGCLALLILALAVISIGVVLYLKADRRDVLGQGRKQAKAEVSQAGNVPAEEKPGIPSYNIATPTPSPSPEPTRLLVSFLPMIENTPTPPPTPSPEPTPEPTPSPSLTPVVTASPTPVPDATRAIKRVLPKSSSGFYQPEDFDLRIEGVMWNEENPMALINDEILGVGQKVGELTITEITRKYIEMQQDGIKYRFIY